MSLYEISYKDIISYITINNYNLLIKTRVKNKRTNLGKIYFENRYIITIINIKAKVTWFIK